MDHIIEEKFKIMLLMGWESLCKVINTLMRVNGKITHHMGKEYKYLQMATVTKDNT
jgi:hypothetical protein